MSMNRKHDGEGETLEILTGHKVCKNDKRLTRNRIGNMLEKAGGMNLDDICINVEITSSAESFILASSKSGAESNYQEYRNIIAHQLK
jgi:hypothetical protein